MGADELNQNNDIKEETNKGNILNMQNEHKENLPDPSIPYDFFIPDIKTELSKEICKIIIKTKESEKTDIGFFLSIRIDLELFDCLITKNHIINDDSKNNNIIYIYYEEYKAANILLDKNKRYLRSFKNEGLDISIIEILDEDNISKKYFFEPETDILLINNLIDKEIYIPQYTEGNKLKNAEGIIKNIIKYKISHTVIANKGSSGFPIFLKDSNKIIGIHRGRDPNIDIKYGDFIYPVINIIKEDIRIRRNNGKYINGKYIYDDGKYYIGQFRNNIPNGKGIKYYKNGNILYDGDFIEGKFKGNGKYIYENGEYYIGQFINGLRHGKGTIYDSNGNIKYEGDFINNKAEINKNEILDNGTYYIGQIKNKLRNGKGIEYYSNGNIKYEGR